MPLVKARCENCGAALEVDSSKKRAICHHCDTPYLVEDAINYFNFNFSGVHSNGDHHFPKITLEMSMRLEAAEASLKLGKYDDALNRFRELSDHIPQDFRVWWGQIRAISKNLTAAIENRAGLEELCRLYDAMMHFVPEHKRGDLERRFMDYCTKQEEILEQRIEALTAKKLQLEEEHAGLQQSIEECRQVTNQFGDQIGTILGIGLVVLVILGSAGIEPVLTGVLVIGIIAFILVSKPIFEEQTRKWEEEKEQAIAELTQRSQNVEQQLTEVNDQLSKMKNNPNHMER